MKKPKIKSSEVIYSGFFDLRQDLLERSDGLTLHYTSVILSRDAVVVLAQDANGLWILNREYRHPTGKTLLGLPGGTLNPGEDPIEAGRRELFEETGYSSDEMAVLGSCHPFPGICDQTITYLLAKNATKKGSPSLDPFEFIEVELKTDKELHDEIRRGLNIDGNVCIALWYKSLFC